MPASAATDNPDVQVVAPACLYEGEVFHKRFRPKKHALRYSVFAFWLDPLKLTQLSRTNKLVSYNRFNVFSIYDRDFAGGNLADIRNYLREQLEPLGDVSGLTDIRLLCYPRIFGYAFNPICVYYVYSVRGSLIAVVYEVRNTFGESTAYPFIVESALIVESGNMDSSNADSRNVMAQTEPADDEVGNPVRPQERLTNFVNLHGCAKEMHVSPFTPMDMNYQFKLKIPDAGIKMSIRLYDSEGTMLTASFAGNRQVLGDARLLRNVFLFPFMTVKVTAGIHWEALKLWLKKVPWFPHTGNSKTGDTNLTR